MSPNLYVGILLHYVHSHGNRKLDQHVYVMRGTMELGLITSTDRGDFGTKWAGQRDTCTIYLHTGNSSTTKCGPEKSESLIHHISTSGDKALLKLWKASPLTTHVLLIRKWRPLDIWGSGLLRTWAASTPAQDVCHFDLQLWKGSEAKYRLQNPQIEW